MAASTSNQKSSRKKSYRSKNKKRSSVPAATKQYVKNLLPKIETKEIRFHTNEVGLNTLSQGYFLQGPLIVQGTSRSSRIGNEVSAIGLDIRGVLCNNSTTESIVRVLVVSSSGSTDPTLELFQATDPGITGGLSTITGLDAMYYPLNTNDFRIHVDKVVRLAGSATGNGAENVQFMKEHINFPKTRIKFDGNTTGIVNQSWSYHIILIATDANDDTSTGTVAEASFMSRFFYQDA